MAVGSGSGVQRSPGRSSDVVDDAAQAGRGARRRVLLVDDCDDVRLPLCALLQRFDRELEVIQATDGLAALETLERVPGVAAIVLDVMIPRLDGMKLAFALARSPRLRSVPVLLLTAVERDRVASTLALPNVRGYLQKPISPRDVLGRVVELLNEPSVPVADAG